MSNSRKIRSNAKYDLAFVGSGLSSTYTLIRLLEHLRDSPVAPLGLLSLLILEKTNDPYAGVAYGRRAGCNSLLTTSFRDFVPSPERERFIAWLTANLGWVFDEIKAAGGALSRAWLERNLPRIQSRQWDSLYLPRYLFGLFLGQWAQEAIRTARSAGIADCTIARADVTDLRRASGGFEIEACTDDGVLTVQSRKVVLAIGCPPHRSVTGGLKSSGPPNGVCIIDDLYSPSLRETTARMAKCLQAPGRPGDRNVVIIGANAAAAEALYNLMDCDTSRRLVSRCFILSPEGRLPERMDADGPQPPFVPESLDALLQLPAVSAAQIHEAVRRDVATARARSLTIAATFEPITRAVSGLLQKMNRAQREIFACRYGVAIGRLQRRAGREYSDNVEELCKQGRIEHIRGFYTGPLSIEGQAVGFGYRDTDTGAKRTFAVPASVVINCTGAQTLSESPSPLIRNLDRRRLCLANASDRGFAVNDRLEACEGLYVIGPLLAGNIINGTMVWHVEHCGRIMFFGRQLAKTLADDLRAAAMAAGPRASMG